ncbi:MAG TPA: RES family NAD+ phosphorylase [Thermoanaerobaculia bacterium]|nr:RES family NAD+ phosphorylase [Thermoanaerobaculia bacterium]
MFRCHDGRFGATEFNPGFGVGRFHPFSDERGRIVSTIYGASDFEGALSETLFHDIPLRDAFRVVERSVLRPLLISVISARRPLCFAQLHGFGLGRLGLRRTDLIEAEAPAYRATVRWAAALHSCPERYDGLVWMSRQHDTSRAVVLFGDRIERHDLELIDSPLPLYLGRGYRRVLELAEAAGIALVE